jgi:hypothetical protein
VNSRQVSYVLIILIVLGIAVAVFKLVSAGTADTSLSGLLPIAPDVVDQVVLRSGGNEVSIKRVGESADIWRVGAYNIDQARFEEFWATVKKFDGAQLVAQNRGSHARMGVDAENGTEVEFLLGNSVQERFIVGIGSETVALCYLRRQDRDNVYAVPCRFSDLFASDADSWRDPTIVTIPLEVIGAFTLRYPRQTPEEVFTVSISESAPFFHLQTEGGPVQANTQATASILGGLQVLRATGFASEAEAARLERDFEVPDASLLLGPRKGLNAPTVRILFVERDGESYWVRNTATATVYIASRQVVEAILAHTPALLAPEEGG